MNKIYSRAVILTLLLLSFTNATFVTAKDLLAPPRVMVFGDSLSAAYGLLIEQGWVALMAQKFKPKNIDVVNASITGETTQGGLSRLPTDLARHKPAMVLIELGANDGLRGLPVADSRKNLEAMIALVKAAHAIPVLIGMQIPPNYGIAYANDFKNQFSVLAKQHKIALVPFLLEGFADMPEKFQADHLHPKAEAEPIILDNVLSVVSPLLKLLAK